MDTGTENRFDVIIAGGGPAGSACALRLAGSGLKVAIIDTGIDRHHPDLDANYAGGYDFVNSDNDPTDDNGHGTNVAGVIAAFAGLVLIGRVGGSAFAIAAQRSAWPRP